MYYFSLVAMIIALISMCSKTARTDYTMQRIKQGMKLFLALLLAQAFLNAEIGQACLKKKSKVVKHSPFKQGKPDMTADVASEMKRVYTVVVLNFAYQELS